MQKRTFHCIPYSQHFGLMQLVGLSALSFFIIMELTLDLTKTTAGLGLVDIMTWAT